MLLLLLLPPVLRSGLHSTPQLRHKHPQCSPSMPPHSPAPCLILHPSRSHTSGMHTRRCSYGDRSPHALCGCDTGSAWCSRSNLHEHTLLVVCINVQCHLPFKILHLTNAISLLPLLLCLVDVHMPYRKDGLASVSVCLIAYA